MNIHIASPVIIKDKLIAMINGGIVFPIRISKEESGLTISWSKVPSSLSLAIDIAVKSIEIISASIVTIETTKNHLYSMFGLNQFLITRFTPP